jgi:hypothetical protein
MGDRNKHSNFSFDLLRTWMTRRLAYYFAFSRQWANLNIFYEHPVLLIPIIPVVSLRPSCICHYVLLEFFNPISSENFIVQSLTSDCQSFLRPRVDVSFRTTCSFYWIVFITKILSEDRKGLLLLKFRMGR